MLTINIKKYDELKSKNCKCSRRLQFSMLTSHPRGHSLHNYFNYSLFHSRKESLHLNQICCIGIFLYCNWILSYTTMTRFVICMDLNCNCLSHDWWYALNYYRTFACGLFHQFVSSSLHDRCSVFYCFIGLSFTGCCLNLPWSTGLERDISRSLKDEKATILYYH